MKSILYAGYSSDIKTHKIPDTCGARLSFDNSSKTASIAIPNSFQLLDEPYSLCFEALPDATLVINANIDKLPPKRE